MEMSDDEKRLEAEAIRYAKAKRTGIARRLADPAKFVPEENPVSVFMAGSPGAGKTEASIELLHLKGADGARILRIDPDELRAELPGYSGSNAWLFQRAVTPLVERIRIEAEAELHPGRHAGEL